MIKYKTIEECRSRNRLTSFRVSSQEWRLFFIFWNVNQDTQVMIALFLNLKVKGEKERKKPEATFLTILYLDG